APNTKLSDALADGATFEAGAALGGWAGLAVEILPLERLVLNFVQRLSGVATATRRHVREVEGTTAEVYDTRKTTPGWRKLEKYAVRVGGGRNHREGLFDAALIKDNHLALARKNGMGVQEVVGKVREAVGKEVFVEVEVASLADLDEALSSGADAVLLDNMSVQELREAVARAKRKRAGIELEASGGVGLANIRRIAETGVTRISVGALTHSARALDIAFECVP
ncbi:MAG: carboxylating nicotinate-nucleotide diphosphorylase, partial [Planctomycetota bacterium]